MFSGIIAQRGKIADIQLNESTISIASDLFSFSDVSLGDSIAVNGVCLTVVSKINDRCVFDLASETLRKTSLRDKKPGDLVNLELSLAIGIDYMVILFLGMWMRP